MLSWSRRVGQSPVRRSSPVYQLAYLENRYLDYHRALGHSPQTIAQYTDTFPSFQKVLDTTGTLKTKEFLTTPTMNAYAGWRKGSPTKGFRDSTHRREHDLHGPLKDLKAFCPWLVAEDFLDKGPRSSLPELSSTHHPVLPDDELLREFATDQLSLHTEIGCRSRALATITVILGTSPASSVRMSSCTGCRVKGLLSYIFDCEVPARCSRCGH